MSQPFFFPDVGVLLSWNNWEPILLTHNRECFHIWRTAAYWRTLFMLSYFWRVHGGLATILCIVDEMYSWNHEIVVAVGFVRVLDFHVIHRGTFSCPPNSCVQMTPEPVWGPLCCFPSWEAYRQYWDNLSLPSPWPPPQGKPSPNCSTDQLLPFKFLSMAGLETMSQWGSDGYQLLFIREVSSKKTDPIFRSLSLWFLFYWISFC